MYIPNCVNMHDVCSYTVHTLNNVDNSGFTQLNEQYNDHSIIPYMETTINNLPMLHNVTLESVQQSNFYPVSLFNVVSYDVTCNADIWYCYKHGYPSGTHGGFYLLDISCNDGQIHIFQCVVQPNAPLYISGSSLLCIQPITVINQHVHQDLLDVQRAFDNYKGDQFNQYAFGVNYESYMDQLIGSLIDFQDKYYCDITDESKDLNLNEHGNIDKESVVVAPTVDTRCSGIVNSPLCQDINYSNKVRVYIALEPIYLLFIRPDRTSIDIDSNHQNLDVT